MEQEEAYDLERVTATMDAMRARRQHFPTTCGFDLAELSSGEDSDDGPQSDSTNSLPSDDDGGLKQHSGRVRRLKTRIQDSLDLSMSVKIPLPCKGQVLLLTKDKPLKPEAVSKVSKIPRFVQRRQLNAATNCKTSVLKRDGVDHRPTELRREMRRSSGPKAQKQTQSPVYHRLSSRESLPDESIALPSTRKSAAKMLAASTDPLASTGRPNISTAFVQDRKKVGSNKSDALDNLDSPSAAERELLQSLERLDRRLTNVSVVQPTVREGGQVRLGSELNLVRCTSESYRSVQIINGEIDKEMVRTAAYGGGTHCKLHQPTSLAVRSSSVKRAELSTGVHKARVRVGGAFVHDTGRSIDGTGKHKVIVKKDLAHLLF